MQPKDPRPPTIQRAKRKRAITIAVITQEIENKEIKIIQDLLNDRLIKGIWFIFSQNNDSND